MTLCPGCSGSSLCPRCNQWRTPGQIGAEGVCGACQCEGPECARPITSRRRRLCHGHYAQLRRGETLTPLRPKHRRAELIEDVEDLAGSDTLDSIAARLGIKPNSIYRTLQRAGRVDLWRRLKGAA